MARRAGGFTPSTPGLSSPQQHLSPDASARNHSKTPGHQPSSPGPVFRQVKLHATPGDAQGREPSMDDEAARIAPSLRLKAMLSEAPSRGQRSGGASKGKSQPTPPQTPRANNREPPQRMPADSEDRDLSPLSTAANMSTVASGSQYEASTAASETFSGTKVLLKASEMIHVEVKSCENRIAALFEAEREAREFSQRQLRQDVEAMVTIVEALSSQVNRPPVAPVDPRLDAFLEQEKRARDALREEVEALCDQVSCLDEDRLKDPHRGVSTEDIESIRSSLEKDRAAQNLACAELRKDLEALSTQERSARDLSNAVLRKDFKEFRKELECLAADVRQKPPVQPDETHMNDVLEQHRAVLDGTCAELRKDIEALSVVVRSLPPADVSSKCTGGTGNSEDELGSNLVSISEVQHIFVHRLQQQKEEMGQVEKLTEELRMDLASSSQVVHLRLEKVDQAISDLQWDVRASQALQRCLVDAVNLKPDEHVSI